MENENKKPQVIIIGMGPETVMSLEIAHHVARLQKTHEIIYVESADKIKEKTGLDVDINSLPQLKAEDFGFLSPEATNLEMLKKNLEFSESIKFKNYRVDTPEISLREVHNPWPSPKGRRGKRRY